jgi:hypothetical protein
LWQRFGQQVQGSQQVGAQQAFSQQAGAQAAGAQAFTASQQLPSRAALELVTLMAATTATTTSAGNKIRRYMGGTPCKEKTLWDTNAK